MGYSIREVIDSLRDPVPVHQPAHEGREQENTRRKPSKRQYLPRWDSETASRYGGDHDDDERHQDDERRGEEEAD